MNVLKILKRNNFNEFKNHCKFARECSGRVNLKNEMESLIIATQNKYTMINQAKTRLLVSYQWEMNDIADVVARVMSSAI